MVDYPNSSRAKKYYLVVEAGVRRNLAIVETVGKTGEDEMISEEEPGKNEVSIAKRRKLIRKRKSDRRAHTCLLYTSPSPRDKRQSRMPSSA